MQFVVPPPVRNRLLPFALLLALAGCAEEESPAQPGIIEGVIRDEQSGDRLKGARVEFTADTLETKMARSDSDGKYGLYIESRSPKGRLRVSKSGYEPRIVSVYLDADEVQIDVDLAPRED